MDRTEYGVLTQSWRDLEVHVYVCVCTCVGVFNIKWELHYLSHIWREGERTRELISIEFQLCARHCALVHKTIILYLCEESIVLLASLYSWGKLGSDEEIQGHIDNKCQTEYVYYGLIRKVQKGLWKTEETRRLISCFPSVCRMDEGDAVIMHPGILCIMVRLLPRLYHKDHPQVRVDNNTYLSFFFTWLIFFFKGHIYLFLERGEGREKERERNTSVWLSLMWPPLGPGPQPSHMPWLGIELVTLWFTVWAQST